MITEPTPSKFRPYTRQTILLARQWQWMSADQQEAVQVLSHVMPFRTNRFVLEQLIDWHNIPDDPIFRLTFPQRDMLPAEEYAQLRELVLFKKNAAAIADMARRIQMRMNPRWAGQDTHSVPVLDRVLQRGLQHKYEDTVQFFPSGARTCHAHCASCGRPPQFATMDTMKLDARAAAGLVTYLRAHPEVSDVLVTGGDPLVFAGFDPDATGLHQLVPAFGRKHFFFEIADADASAHDSVIPIGQSARGSSPERRAIPEPA
ncbi:MAG: hypothetical protein V7631_919 [Massilia sp.]